MWNVVNIQQRLQFALETNVRRKFYLVICLVNLQVLPASSQEWSLDRDRWLCWSRQGSHSFLADILSSVVSSGDNLIRLWPAGTFFLVPVITCKTFESPEHYKMNNKKLRSSIRRMNDFVFSAERCNKKFI